MKVLGYLIGVGLIADGAAAIFYPDVWARYTKAYTSALGSRLWPESKEFDKVVEEYISLPRATVNFWAGWEIGFGIFMLKLASKVRD